MKKFISAIIFLIIGSLITLTILFAFTPNRKTVTIGKISGVPLRSAVFTSDDSGNIVPLNFTEASSKVMGAVVNVRSARTITAQERSNQQIPEAFREFFGDDFFRYYFGPERQNPGGNGPPQAVTGIGSGVIISEDGYIVTNNHVIANADEIEVTLYDNRNYIAEIVGSDPSTDLALLKIKENNLPTVPMVNSDDVQVGEWVLAVGNPYELSSTVTAGIISAKGRSINIFSDEYAVESFIQTDAAINPGNSGGALVTLDGGLVGINTAIASPTGSYSGYGFAIPSNIVSKIVKDIIEFGKVQRGFLGVMIRNISGDFAREEDLDVTEGAYIDSIIAGGSAEKAGLQAGDVIIAVGGKDIRMASQLQERIAEHRPGDKVNVTVNRKGQIKEITATLQGSGGSTKLLAKEESSAINELGAEFRTVDKKLAEKLKIEGGVQVVKLSPGPITKQTNLKEGFIITKVNEKTIKSVEELNNAIKGKKGGVMFEGIYDGVPGVYYYAFGI